MRVRDGLPEYLHFNGQAVGFIFGCREMWSVDLRDIRAIGEYTTDLGPFTDDWFVVFVRHDGKWFEAPADLPTTTSVLNDLQSALHAPLTLGLTNSAECASRVIWPSRLAGQPLFVFSWATPKAWLARTVGLKRIGISLTTEVTELAMNR